MADGRPGFIRSYQVAPIILVDGIAAAVPQGKMTILSLTEGTEDVNYPNESDYFANFKILPGGTLIDFTPAEYPYASMSMAANAMLQQALKFSMEMICPIRNGRNNYTALQQTITRIQQRTEKHNLSGGSYTVGTPGFIYTNCLLTSLRDTSSAGDKTVQARFQWDFVCPLITAQQAEATFNNLYSKLQNGLPVSNPPTNSGLSASIGGNTTQG